MSNYTDLRDTLEKLQEELLKSPPEGPLEEDFSSHPELKEAKDLVISQDTLNIWNGTTLLLKQIFDPHTCINIQHTQDINPQNNGPFISYKIEVEGKSDLEIFASLVKVLVRENIRRIICVPYYTGSYQLGIFAKNILGVPLVVWTMDVSFSVPASLMSELLRLADIRFAISPEMRDFYENKFPYKFYILPPTVKASWVGRFPQADISRNLSEKTCLMIGGVWAPSWMKNLCEMVKKSGWTIHWYCSPYANSWLPAEELASYGIVEKGFLPQEEMAALAATYPFAIAPTGLGNESDERKELTFYSLPSRIPFLLATAYLPILVIGNETSCAAKFVRRFGVGLTTGYEEKALLAALEKLSHKEFLAECSQNAAAHAPLFSDEGLEAWIWDSCEKRAVVDDRFEKHFLKEPGNLTTYRDEDLPKNLDAHFHKIYTSLRRLARRGYRPDFVLDIGASSGIWSVMAQRIFPQARFILIEPLANRYPQWYGYQYPQFEWVFGAASDQDGKMTIQVTPDLYGSSILHSGGSGPGEFIEVPVVTLDTVLKIKAICGRGILKADVQGAEHLVLAGAHELLKKVDIIILELTLPNVYPGGKTFLEMLPQMELLGFDYFDDVGEWRHPMSGILEQKDVLFVNRKMSWE